MDAFENYAVIQCNCITVDWFVLVSVGYNHANCRYKMLDFYLERSKLRIQKEWKI